MFVAKPPHTSRGPSRELWNLSRAAEIAFDPGAGFILFDDFLKLQNDSDWVVDNATAGTAVLDDADGGVVILDAASATVDQGVQMQWGANNAGTVAAAEIIKCEADTEVIFECRVKIHDFSATALQGPQLFFGLSEKDTSLFGSGVNSSANHIGFECAEASAYLQFVAEKATVRGTVANVHLMVDSDITANSWVKLGFRVIGLDKVEAYVNGVLNSSTIATANIPIVEMTPSFACLVGDSSSADTLFHMDWMYCIKKYRIG